MRKSEQTPTLIFLTVFAIAMALLEAVVVVYLRKIYYPSGFTFPLVAIAPDVLVAELLREAATVVMILAVAFMSVKTRWLRFAAFMIVFAVWDIWYYVWLKVLLDWPATLLDWDVLFLIPIPWIGPVIAPLAIALLMLASGGVIFELEKRGRTFAPNVISVIAATLGSALVLFTFMQDTGATMRFQSPKPFDYLLFSIGWLLMASGFAVAWRNTLYGRKAR